jgi:cell wall-associated NlpC family hydrolase
MTRRRKKRGDLVAAEARTWCGTPFRWQASQKGVGCDCKGLVWGVARELGFPEADSLYANMADYSPNRPVDGKLLKRGLSEVFDPVEDMRPGDVLLLKIGRNPSHLAIYVGDGKAVHAQIGSKDWVKEASLRSLLKMFPLDSVWRWRDGC